jgi:hypothetical protein
VITRSFVSVTCIIIAAVALQGCVAAVLPAIAAGGLAKRQIDVGKKRAREAEAEMKVAEQAPPPPPPIVEVLDQSTTPSAETGGMTATERLEKSSIRSLYLPFARHALEQAALRKQGGSPKSAVLANKVSLTNPVAIPCGNKPMVAIIDVDIAPSTPAEIEIEPQKGFGPLLQVIREADIRIAWISDMSEEQASPNLEILRKGDEPALSDKDIMLFGHPRFRKQEQRWQLARDNCVVAIAGDRKGDFDELYDYLRDPDYAIRLDGFINRGWFLLPPPAAAVDSDLVAADPE